MDGKHRRRLVEGFLDKPVLIERCCRILSREIVVPVSEPILGMHRLVCLQGNLYRRRMARVLADARALDATLMAMARRVEVRRIVRPHRGFDLDALCRLVTE